MINIEARPFTTLHRFYHTRLYTAQTQNLQLMASFVLECYTHFIKIHPHMQKVCAQQPKQQINSRTSHAHADASVFLNRGALLLISNFIYQTDKQYIWSECHGSLDIYHN